MQKYLQQAEQQHKQELLETQLQVQDLRDNLLKAQAQLQEVGGLLMHAAGLMLDLCFCSGDVTCPGSEE
jgi:hypothetical protein